MNRSYPPSCCEPSTSPTSKAPTASAVMNRNDDGSATFTGQLKNATGNLTASWNHMASEVAAKADDIRTVTVCKPYSQVRPHIHVA